MKINTTDKMNKLKEHLLNTYPDGKFSANSYTFNKIIGANSTAYYMELLVKKGFLKLIKKTTKEGKKWIPAEYQIIGTSDIDDTDEFKNENTSNNEKEKVTQGKIDINDYIEEQFNNIPVRLYKTDKGYVVPISNIINALNTTKQHLHGLLKDNEELFDNWVVNLTLTTDSAVNTCLTRDGVIGLLMKISYKRLTPDKQKLVLEFQKWAIEKLGRLMSTGEVKISNIEHSNAKVNIADTVGISNEDIEKMFTEIQNTVDEKLGMIKLLIDNKNKEVTSAKLERDMAIEREKRMMSRIPEIVDQRFELMMKKLA